MLCLRCPLGVDGLLASRHSLRSQIALRISARQPTRRAKPCPSPATHPDGLVTTSRRTVGQSNLSLPGRNGVEAAAVDRTTSEGHIAMQRSTSTVTVGQRTGPWSAWAGPRRASQSRSGASRCSEESVEPLARRTGKHEQRVAEDPRVVLRSLFPTVPSWRLVTRRSLSNMEESPQNAARKLTNAKRAFSQFRPLHAFAMNGDPSWPVDGCSLRAERRLRVTGGRRSANHESRMVFGGLHPAFFLNRKLS